MHFVRSAVAHARITAVDVSAALAAPGVIAAFTGADLDLDELAPPMAAMINAQMSQPLLARDVVRFVGEPVAVVVTEGRYQGEDAADLVDVDYDLLPPVVEMAEADAPGAAVLFPAAGSNVAATFGDPAALAPTCSPAARWSSPGPSSTSGSRRPRWRPARRPRSGRPTAG